MAKSVAAFPLRFNGRGGLKAPPSDNPGASLDQVIVVELQPGETMMPWDRAAGIVAPSSVFRRNPAPTVGHVEAFFDDLRAAGRAVLRAPLASDGPSRDGKTIVQVRYTNLEGQYPNAAEGNV